jgi:hypothetical protein
MPRGNTYHTCNPPDAASKAVMVEPHSAGQNATAPENQINCRITWGPMLPPVQPPSSRLSSGPVRTDTQRKAANKDACDKEGAGIRKKGSNKRLKTQQLPELIRNAPTHIRHQPHGIHLPCPAVGSNWFAPLCAQPTAVRVSNPQTAAAGGQGSDLSATMLAACMPAQQ